ncbi:MAG: hypothetical protein ACR2GN_07710 [Bacteroidia bacterium]
MKRIIFTFCIVSIISVASAQDYTFAIGAKVGKFSSGISGKYFFQTTNSTAIEGNLTFKKNFGTSMITLYLDKHFQLRNSQLQIPLDCILGVGVHAAYYKPGYYRIKDGGKDAYYNEGITLGIDAKLGLEHPFSFMPLTIGIEASPFLDLVNPGPEYLELAAVLRYAFN